MYGPVFPGARVTICADGAAAAASYSGSTYGNPKRNLRDTPVVEIRTALRLGRTAFGSQSPHPTLEAIAKQPDVRRPQLLVS